MAKRDAASAELPAPEPKESNTTQPLFFVYATSDRCFSICVEKLLAKAPNSYFAMLWTRRNQMSGEGESQANPMRVAVPEWFVQAVADWAQPMAPSDAVFVGIPDKIALEQLRAVGWSSVGEGDLPTTFKPTTSEPGFDDECTRILEHTLLPNLPSGIIRSLGEMKSEATSFTAAFVPSTASLELPGGVQCDVIYKVNEQVWADMVDACGLSGPDAPSRFVRHITRENSIQTLNVVRKRRIANHVYNYITVTLIYQPNHWKG